MATVTNLKLNQSRRLYVSATDESTFGTAETLTHVLNHPIEFSPLIRTQENVLSSGFASGDQTDHPTTHLPVRTSLRGNLSVWASLESLGIFMAKAFASGDTLAGGGPYTHTIAYSTAPTYLPGMTIEEHFGGATVDATNDRKYLGVCIDSFEFSFGMTGFAMINCGLIGSGRVDSASSQTESGMTTPSYFLAAPKIRVGIEAATSEHTSPWDGGHEVSATAGTFATIDASATDISHLIESFTLRVNNGGTNEFLAGSSISTGVYAGQPFTGNRTVEVEFTAMLDDNTEPLINALADSTTADQNEYACYIDIAGNVNGYGAQIVVPLMALAENPSGGTGSGPGKYTFRFLARKTSAGTSRSVISAYVANQDNYDYM